MVDVAKALAEFSPELLFLQRRNFLHFKPHAKQLHFYAMGMLGAKERFFFGGNRTGKTLGGAYEMAMHLTGYYPDWWPGVRFNKPIQAWAATVDGRTQRDALQMIYFGDTNQGLIGAIHPQMVAHRYLIARGQLDSVLVKHKSGGISSLSFRTYEQGRDAFQAAEIDFAQLDEEPPWDIYTEVLMRLFARGGYCITTMTPLKGKTELVTHAMETREGKETAQRQMGRVKNGVGYLQVGWQDNPHLKTDEIARLRSTLKPHEIEAREKGIPYLGGGKVYPVQEELLSCQAFPIPSHWPQGFGVDFGWTNPTARVNMAWDRDNDVLYITGCYKVPEMTPKQHAKNWEESRWDWMSGVCDPAGQAASQKDGENLVAKYREAGVKLLLADNSVEAGIAEVLQRMNSGRFKVFAHLEEWWHEFRLYRRQPQGEKDAGRIVKKDDHLMDATRYATMARLLFQTNQPVKGSSSARASGFTA